MGDGQGDWWLEMQTDLDISPQAFARTSDGAVAALNGVETATGDGRCYVPYFEPGNEWSSWLRLVNAGADDAEIGIEGLDDLGESAPGGNVGLTLPANRSRTLGAAELEAGAAGLRDRLGDGSGAWRLFVSSDRPIRVVNLRKTANGRLTALSECEETQRPDGTVFTDNMLGVLDKASDPYELIAASVAGDTLTATVAYGGGCEPHEFTLLVSDAFMMSDPVRLRIAIAHNANRDPCEAWLTEDVSFDLTPIRDMYGEEHGVIVLLLPNAPNGELRYEF